MKERKKAPVISGRGQRISYHTDAMRRAGALSCQPEEDISPDSGPENVTLRDVPYVYGRNAVRELLSEGRDIDKIYVARGDRTGSIVALVGEAITRRIPVVEVDRRKLDQMCGHASHQGILAMAAERNYVRMEEILAYASERGEPPLLVLADGITDPHNLGALIRSAECAGAHGLILPKRHSSGLTAVVSKTSAGAIEHLRIAKVSNLSTAIDWLKKQGVWIYAADMNGRSYYETEMRGPTALVLGSEGAGISRLVREKCDFAVSIPLYGQINSLNVSAAGAVLLCEVARQRHSTGR